MNCNVLLTFKCSDRYVVLSASGEGVGVALELAKIFNQIQGEYRWKPRRSIIFCLFSGSLNSCPEILSNLMPHKIVAYIVVHHQVLQGLLLTAKLKGD